MTEVIDIIRAIVRDELRSVRLGELAVVTAIEPHADGGDLNNHDCSVKLRESGLELTKVPIATPHVGMVSAPAVGDVVLLVYVNGDPNRPVVLGRFYTDATRAPVHKEKEWRVESPPGGTTSIAIQDDGAIVIAAGETKLTLRKDDVIEIAGKQDLKIEVQGNVALKCADCKLDASGNVEIGSGGSGVITANSHKCYFTGAPLVGSASVKAKG
jgi:phage baseplate assembly protein gpV